MKLLTLYYWVASRAAVGTEHHIRSPPEASSESKHGRGASYSTARALTLEKGWGPLVTSAGHVEGGLGSPLWPPQQDRCQGPLLRKYPCKVLPDGVTRPSQPSTAPRLQLVTTENACSEPQQQRKAAIERNPGQLMKNAATQITSNTGAPRQPQKQGLSGLSRLQGFGGPASSLAAPGAPGAPRLPGGPSLALESPMQEKMRAAEDLKVVQQTTSSRSVALKTQPRGTAAARQRKKPKLEKGSSSDQGAAAAAVGREGSNNSIADKHLQKAEEEAPLRVQLKPLGPQRPLLPKSRAFRSGQTAKRAAPAAVAAAAAAAAEAAERLAFVGLLQPHSNSSSSSATRCCCCSAGEQRLPACRGAPRASLCACGERERSTTKVSSGTSTSTLK
ncbi:hypothetical protein Efla_007839 [Eimeria flavescens]